MHTPPIDVYTLGCIIRPYVFKVACLSNIYFPMMLNNIPAKNKKIWTSSMWSSARPKMPR